MLQKEKQPLDCSKTMQDNGTGYDESYNVSNAYRYLNLKTDVYEWWCEK